MKHRPEAGHSTPATSLETENCVPILGGTAMRPNHPDPESELLKEEVAFRNAVADWFLRHAQRCMRRRELNSALEWNHLAARALSRGCNPLVSKTIEQNLVEIARQLPSCEWQRLCERGARRRWLHVIEVALPYGGLTAMAQRWIVNDAGNSTHSVVLLAQEHPVPEMLAAVVRDSGGKVFLPEPKSPLLSRANWLRRLAYAEADCVVLHIANDNVIPLTAFGVDGGPPVLFVNHAAHKFWLGVASVDLVINCRGSELESFWTRHYRGIARSATLPIPIPAPAEQAAGEVFTPEFRAAARQRLGLPGDATVLLSVGRGEKYNPIRGLNFFDVSRSILVSCPQTHLLVVGPSATGHWKELQEELSGRVRAVGLQSDLTRYHAAADVYIEGFPFGSTTALLEAGVHGIPCVLAPAECEPPFGTDGIAIDHILRRPANVNEYKKRVKELIQDPAERLRNSSLLARSIRDHHCDAGWIRYLSELTAQVPQVHAVNVVTQPPSPPDYLDYYWTRYVNQLETDTLSLLFGMAEAFELTPRLDPSMYKAYRRAKRVRRRCGRLRLSSRILMSAVLPLFPIKARHRIYRQVVSLCDREGLVSRIVRAVRGSSRWAWSFVSSHSRDTAAARGNYRLCVGNGK